MATVAPKRSAPTTKRTYHKLTQLDHVLKRANAYIGSVEHREGSMWTIDDEANLKYREVSVVPGLYKICDEILVYAAENKVRDPCMETIKVSIDVERKEISVLNDGRGIPIEMHTREKMYVPELIFGNLLTSSYYDDEDQSVTEGRNGFGAKLCNIFSTEFTIETADQKLLYQQTWRNNMGSVDPPVISRNSTGKSFTKITFRPDLAKFGMTEFEPDFLAVLRRRVYDIAGTVHGTSVFLDERLIGIKDFEGYASMFRKGLTGNNSEDVKLVVMSPPQERWEVVLLLGDGIGFHQMSFVNSIATTSGGTHVDYITDQIVKCVSQSASRTRGISGKLTKAQIKNNVFVFINCQISNPSFSSQTKERVTTKMSQLGSRCELPPEFLESVMSELGGRED